MNFKINKGVLWLKVGYSLWAMATAMVMPFIALQMSSKGLSDGDISLILGVMPFSLVFIMPFIGKYRIIDSHKNVAFVLLRNAWRQVWIQIHHIDKLYFDWSNNDCFSLHT